MFHADNEIGQLTDPNKVMLLDTILIHRRGLELYIIQYLSLDYTMHCTHIFVQYSNTIAHLKYVTREENLISNTSLKTLYTLQCLTRNFWNVSLNVLLNLKKYKCAQSEPTPIPNHLHTQLFIFYSIL